MTTSPLTTPREALYRAVASKLQDAGYTYSRLNKTWNEFLCDVLNDLASTNVSPRAVSGAEVLARLLNHLNGSSLSPLTTALGGLLAGVANATISGGGGGGGGGSFFGLENSSGAFLLESSGHISLEA